MTDRSHSTVSAQVNEYLLGLACGHFWPGDARDDDEARSVLGLFMVTGDLARCQQCKTMQRITGPVAKVLASSESEGK